MQSFKKATSDAEAFEKWVAGAEEALIDQRREALRALDEVRQTLEYMNSPWRILLKFAPCVLSVLFTLCVWWYKSRSATRVVQKVGPHKAAMLKRRAQAEARTKVA